MIRKHLFLIIALTALCLMVVAGALRLGVKAKPAGQTAAAGAQRGGGAGAGRGTPVALYTVSPSSFQEEITVLGVAKARQSVTLTADTTELITRIHFQSGDLVREGQVLAELNMREQTAGIAQTQAAVDLAKSTWDRWQTLADRGIAPRATAEQYKSAYDQAVANLEASRARVADRTIRAPFSGVVGLTDAAPGMLLNVGAPIATLDDLSVIKVDFPVSETYLSTLREGLSLTATADAYPQRRFIGRIAKIDTRVDPATRSVTARAEFPNADRKLKPGMLLHVTVQQGARTNPAVPEPAVMFEGGTAYVYMFKPSPGKGATAARRTVVTGMRQGGQVEVVTGLDAGERIVAEGVNRIRANETIYPAGDRAGGQRRAS